MDGLTLTASVFELMKLIDGKIEKIQQPEKFELLFFVHTRNGNKKLLISASPDNSRIHLTEEKKQSPALAPNFLMLLRKHLQSSRIVSIEQPNADRIVIIKFSAYNELNDATELRLVCEIMGKHSNIILVDKNDIILDSIRRVSPSMSSARLILPKLRYQYPPTVQKHNPLLASEDDFIDCISNSPRMDKALSNEFYGLSPSIAGILIDSIINKNGLAENDSKSIGHGLYAYYSLFSNGYCQPCIAKFGDNEVLLPFIPAASDFIEFSCLSDAIDEFYRSNAQLESIKHRTSALKKVLSNHIHRLERKIERFSLLIVENDKIENLKLCGELLTANMFKIPPHITSIKLENYYQSPPQPILIELDPMLTVAQNAQNYYKEYRKAQTAKETAIEQLEAANIELEYLNGIADDLSLCLNNSDLEEIKDELISQGYIRKPSIKHMKLPKSKPYRFLSTDGIEILVGKNNTQNDKLTFKHSMPEYTWMHTKDIHGSHVIVCCEGLVPQNTLSEAARLAAYYSQARNSNQVPVDYTKKKYVKKPSGGRPGMAYYTNQKTIYVVPELCLTSIKENL